jgi:hypothetical protein
MATTTLRSVQPIKPGVGAAALARLGLRVFPLMRGTGLPAISAWPTRASSDPERVRAWWTGDYAGYGVGIATGAASGMWALDLDVKKGADGIGDLRRLIEADGGDFAPFTATWRVVTPSGGAHLYFRWDGAAGADGGIGNSSKQLAPGIDVRGEGGYVRGPGTIGYHPVNQDEPVRFGAAPAWLLALARKRTHDPRVDSAQRTGSSMAKWETGRILSGLAAAPEGGRNSALNRAAFFLALGGGMERENAWEACKSIMTSIGARDSERAQRRTFESGWDSGTARRGA